MIFEELKEKKGKNILIGTNMLGRLLKELRKKYFSGDHPARASI